MIKKKPYSFQLSVVFIVDGKRKEWWRRRIPIFKKLSEEDSKMRLWEIRALIASNVDNIICAHSFPYLEKYCLQSKMIANKYLAGLDVAEFIIVSILVLIAFKIWPWCCKHLIPALDKLKEKDWREFKASLDFTVKCRLILTTEQDAFLKISREINK